MSQIEIFLANVMHEGEEFFQAILFDIEEGDVRTVADILECNSCFEDVKAAIWDRAYFTNAADFENAWIAAMTKFHQRSEEKRLRKSMDPVRALLTLDCGYTISGGMWGDAAWKQHGDYVFALGQGYPGEYLSAPSEMNAPTRVSVFSGGIWSGWSVEDGEAPCRESGSDVDFMPFLFPDLYAALEFVQFTIGNMMTEEQVAASVKQALEAA